MSDNATITPKELAVLLDSDPKTVRRFLRSQTTERANKGGRWEISVDDVEELTARFKARHAGTKLVIDAPTAAEVVEAEDEDEVIELEDDEDIDELV